MPHSLESFHFNARKSGQIFKQIAKERGLSQATMAARTGVSYDTVGNVYAGKVQDIQFERVFKFCVVLGIPIEVYMMLMLQDEEIDFAEQVLLYNNRQDDVTPVSDVDPAQVPSPVSEAVSAAAVAATEPPCTDCHFPDDDQPCRLYSRDDVTAFLDRIERQHNRHITELTACHDRAYKLLEMVIGRRD